MMFKTKELMFNKCVYKSLKQQILFQANIITHTFTHKKTPTDIQISSLSRVCMHFLFHSSIKIYVGPLYLEILSTHKPRGNSKMQMNTSSNLLKL